jgi:hypothetical protein
VSFKIASTADPIADVAPISTSSVVSWAWGARPIELWIEFSALQVSFEDYFSGFIAYSRASSLSFISLAMTLVAASSR